MLNIYGYISNQYYLLGDVSSVHGVGEVLLVGKDQKEGVPQLILVQHPVKLLPGLSDTVAIVAVDHKDDALSVLEVVAPERPDLVLTSYIFIFFRLIFFFFFF